ncbi:tRNA (adenosine(37)-N6)-threonylcarbamoyltransferase complex ATPase subunit type 1 TsaE [Rickettsiales bacterium (ex Bugula neritina AB1)]|nr:tRNA (adenosine(37)-N6)-threonylcarbamoyltransferase complex ATPase subunit type 1 TsaE [Rickettsiales bacterium (ex Bugula neritina AB1)]
MIVSINNINELEDFVKNFKKKYLPKNNIFLLSGDLGVGKTTFIKYLLKPINVTSPTFNLLNIYNKKYWHMDLYKKNIFTMMDMEDYGVFSCLVDKNNKLFIEWWQRLNFPIQGLELKIFLKKKKRFLEIKNI